MTHLCTRIYYKLWPLYYKYRSSICSRTLALCLSYSGNSLAPLTPLIFCLYLVVETLSEPLTH